MTRIHRTARTSMPLSSVIAGLLGLSLVLPVPEVTQLAAGDSSLRGLPGVAVFAEATSHEVWRLGLKEAWLEQRVTEALRSAAVPRLERSDALGTRHQPLLVVRAMTTPIPGRQACAWHLSLVLRQQVAGLDGAPARFGAETWSASDALGVTSTDRVRASVGKALDAQLAEFVQAWARRTDAP
jgi:hypothetical protein